MYTINIVFRNHISWLEGFDLVMKVFQTWCDLPNVHGAIDCTQIAILKPRGLQNVAYYYCYKIKSYNMMMQVVVDHKERFRVIYVALPGNVNDTRVSQLSSLYYKALHQGLFAIKKGLVENLQPYLLGDKGYPLLSWLMVSYKNKASREHILL